MSIYCSFGCIDDESDRPRSRKRPIRYQGSHVLPGEKDEHSGSVDLAYIPPHISRGRRKGSEDGAFWPWLRMGIAEKNMSAGETVNPQSQASGGASRQLKLVAGTIEARPGVPRQPALLLAVL